MILVIAEQRDGKLNRASWEAIAAAQALGSPVKVAILGSSVSGLASELAAADVAEVLVAENAALASYTPDGYTMGVSALVDQTKPNFVLMPHTYQTRDYAPALAARLGRGLITDVTGIRSQEGALVYSRPVFQGKLSADVQATGPAPHIVTLQIGAYRADAAARAAASTAGWPCDRMYARWPVSNPIPTMIRSSTIIRVTKTSTAPRSLSTLFIRPPSDLAASSKLFRSPSTGLRACPELDEGTRRNK